MTFVPAAWSEGHVQNAVRYLGRNAPVTGTVVYVNEKHRWFRVAYPAGDTILYECIWE
ncbi:MAG: hypothetical protein K6C12_06095 [Oscillospiraceae bacterium]|nr:hypothetical protein [Oscillospiraceae bacterium]